MTEAEHSSAEVTLSPQAKADYERSVDDVTASVLDEIHVAFRRLEHGDVSFGDNVKVTFTPDQEEKFTRLIGHTPVEVDSPEYYVPGTPVNDDDFIHAPYMEFVFDNGRHIQLLKPDQFQLEGHLYDEFVTSKDEGALTRLFQEYSLAAVSHDDTFLNVIFRKDGVADIAIKAPAWIVTNPEN